MAASAKMGRIQSCNVLESGEAGRLWAFEVQRGEARLVAELPAPGDGKLPPDVVGKGWRQLVQRRVNIAWLPPGQAYLRVVQLPTADDAELMAMLEFQLEKLSPIPVAQLLWSAVVLPGSLENSRTAVVVMTPREAADRQLASLEARGFQADSLELSSLAVLLADGMKMDGAWIYPAMGAETDLCLVAWWSDGVLRNLQLMRHGGAEGSNEPLKAQLLNNAWAGEIEGWLSLPIKWHLVGEARQTEALLPALRGLSEEPIEVHEPPARRELAAFAVGRTLRGAPNGNLAPAELVARNRQRFVDRLWMGGLGALVMAYIAGVLVYFGALEVLKARHRGLTRSTAALSGSYTNALQQKERVRILQDQLNLKHAALDCFKSAAENLPEEFQLNWMVFGDKGRSFELHGVGPQGREDQLNTMYKNLRDAQASGQKLFKEVSLPQSSSRGNQQFSWVFKCELNQAEID